ncbi:MAG: sulfatase-like hydrolase/transferase [Candidatus Sumerlaeota bacterium]|nr:sulfatase-like hydrolase/transferase [Candidatus Sumerlaeota bacterium]
MGTWSRREWLKAAGLGAAALAAPRWARAAEAANKKKPNIIFFLSDDVGIDDIGCYGSDTYKNLTPRIDALAKKGIRFETCYCAPLCGPTRCEFNTGRYAFRTGGLTNGAWGAKGPGAKSADEFPIAKMLKQAGYATCSSGKWRQIGETPGDWGYDEWLTDPKAGGWYWQKNYTKNGEEVETPEEVYMPDMAHEFAMDFVKRHRDEPFFVYYPTHLVHGPILRTPDSAPDSKDLYADNVAYMDKLLGKVVDEIEKLGLSENTLIIFTGDNGTAKKSGTIGGREVHGAKGSMWEGGAHVPFVARWKGTTPEGKVLPDLLDFTDMYATFADLAGAKMPEKLTFDGHSFAPQLRGKPGTPREWIFVQLGRHWYVREKDWKLNEAGDLFNMKDAPFVEEPVPADTKDEKALAARKRLQAVLDRLNPAGGKTISAEAEAEERKRAAQRRKAAAPKAGAKGAEAGKAAPKAGAKKAGAEKAGPEKAAPKKGAGKKAGAKKAAEE